MLDSRLEVSATFEGVGRLIAGRLSVGSVMLFVPEVAISDCIILRLDSEWAERTRSARRMNLGRMRPFPPQRECHPIWPILSIKSASSESFERPKVSKKILVVAKLLVLSFILFWLYRSFPADHWETLRTQPKRWHLLGLAFGVILAANVTSFIRWRNLVESLGQPFSLHNAIRLGFLGCLFNLVSIGSVGGDLFKAIGAARLCKGRRPEVIGSVLVDRAMGLLGLIVVAALSLQFLPRHELGEQLQWIKRGTWIVLAIGLGALYGTVAFGRHLPFDWLTRIPLVGHAAYRMAQSGLIFDRRPRLATELLAISCVVHAALTYSTYLISCSLYATAPGLAEHFMVIPPAFAAGALPLTPAGLGVQEMAVQTLFQQIPDLPAEFAGVIPAAMYRLMTFLLAGIGAVYYFLGHDDVQAVQADLHPQTEVQ